MPKNHDYFERATHFATPVASNYGGMRPNDPSYVATGQVYATLALAESIDRLAQAVRELGPQQRIEIVGSDAAPSTEE